MELKQAFGLALRRFRVSKGLSQEDFAIVSSRTYLSSLERGLKSPTIDKVDDLSSRLGMHPLTILACTYLLQNEHLTVDELLTTIGQELSTCGLPPPR
jgi:transcriptional regulator with XRE-family HTH domain